MGKLSIITTYLCFFSFGANAQATKESNFSAASIFATKKINKPYKVLTNGNNITIKAEKKMSSVMAWSMAGNRVSESQQVGDIQYGFTIPGSVKIVFIRIQFSTNEVFSEKVMLGY